MKNFVNCFEIRDLSIVGPTIFANHRNNELYDNIIKIRNGNKQNKKRSELVYKFS